MAKIIAIILIQLVICYNLGNGFSFIKEFEKLMHEGLNLGKRVLTSPTLVKGVVASANELNKLCVKHDFNTPSDSTPKLEDTMFVLMTRKTNYTYSMQNAGQILTNPAFNSNWNTTIFSAGWQSSFNGSNGALFGISNAYLCAGNVNLIVVDTAAYLKSLMYPWAALNTVPIGQFVSIGIQQLYAQNNSIINSIRLLGHSLGAQIVGEAARNFSAATGIQIPHITGLDPAKPCFRKNPRLRSLGSGDALYVDIIHSNPGILGINENIGDADFYPSGHHPIPLGCTSIICAHGRSWKYFSESLYPGNANGFMAENCGSEKSLISGGCGSGAQRYPMGYFCPTSARGNLFLQVNNVAPFGQFSIPPSQVICTQNQRTSVSSGKSSSYHNSEIRF